MTRPRVETRLRGVTRLRVAGPVAAVLLIVALTGCSRLGSHGGEAPAEPVATSLSVSTPSSTDSMDDVLADLDGASGAARQADSDATAGDAAVATDDAP
ncbi:hypothetical protein BH11ACT3_BH11ACT3_01320 [soil metagenome]